MTSIKQERQAPVFLGLLSKKVWLSNMKGPRGLESSFRFHFVNCDTVLQISENVYFVLTSETDVISYRWFPTHINLSIYTSLSIFPRNYNPIRKPACVNIWLALCYDMHSPSFRNYSVSDKGKRFMSSKCIHILF